MFASMLLQLNYNEKLIIIKKLKQAKNNVCEFAKTIIKGRKKMFAHQCSYKRIATKNFKKFKKKDTREKNVNLSKLKKKTKECLRIYKN